MPGVPSGRACEACRKQKKKCDEVQPTCSRCQRVGITCVGSGARRVKWSIETTNHSRGRGTISTSTTIERSASSTPDHEAPLVRRISRSPSNSQTILAMTLIDKVHLTKDSDLRYNLTWAFGNFIQDVPRRLGKNAALDAAATSLALSHVRYSTGRRDAAPEEIKAYINALKVLRGCLDNAEVARDANTLCAVMLLLFAQQMIGLSGNKATGHGEGAAIILRSKGIRYDPHDEFEDMLLQTLRGPLLFEGLFNPKIEFTDEEWHFLITRHVPKVTPNDVSRMIASWATFPKLTSVVRQAWISKSITATDEFKDLLRSTRELYSTTMLTLERLRVVYAQSQQELSDAKDDDVASIARHVFFFNQRMYYMAVFTTCYLNCIIRAMVPVEERVQLRTQAVKFATEIISLAYQAMPLRPLGSAFVPMCLIVAWFTPVDDATREEISRLWDEYRTDFPATKELRITDSVEVCGFLVDEEGRD